MSKRQFDTGPIVVEAGTEFAESGGGSAGGEVCEYDVEFPRCLRATHLAPRTDVPMPPRVPRIARLMALAIHCDRLIKEGGVADYAQLARIGYVTRARITQIMSLLFLAPDIQDEILHLPAVSEGADIVTERHLRAILKMADWRRQRNEWDALKMTDSRHRHRSCDRTA